MAYGESKAKLGNRGSVKGYTGKPELGKGKSAGMGSENEKWQGKEKGKTKHINPRD